LILNSNSNSKSKSQTKDLNEVFKDENHNQNDIMVNNDLFDELRSILSLSSKSDNSDSEFENDFE